MNGWIKLHRKITDNEQLWGSSLTFGLFCYLLLIADKETGKLSIGRFQLAKRFRAKPSTIYQSLKRLERNKQIILKVTRKQHESNTQSNSAHTEITIVNWGKYQSNENKVTHKVNRKQHESNTLQEIRNKKSININNINIGDKPPKIKYKWQDLALRILETIHERNNQSVRGRIMKCCKDDSFAAERAWDACKELNKPYAKYFFAVYNEYKALRAPKKPSRVS